MTDRRPTAAEKAEVNRLIERGSFDYARTLAEQATEQLPFQERQVVEQAIAKVNGGTK